MSDDASFLARWSRRKRSAAANRRDQAKPENAGDGAVVPDTAVAQVAPAEAQPLIDLSNLPPLNSLGAGSDIRPFLAPGVPADLARAALRRAWSVDPAIRDFIGLSENSWDFNAPGGVPGFGVVTTEDVRCLLARAMGEPEAADPASLTALANATDRTPRSVSESDPAAHGAAQEQTKQDQHPGTEHAEQSDPTPHDQASDVAAQRESGERECQPTPLRHRHGSALPE